MSDLGNEKKKLRAKFSAQIPSSVPEQIQASHRLIAHLKSHSGFLKARRVGIYYPRGAEIDPLSLWEPGKEIYFPRVDPNTLEMEFFPVTALNQLKPGFSRILEPPAHQAPADWRIGDWILIPGRAFDVEGGRLGSGLGIFDRFLPKLPKGVVKCGVAFASQLSRDALPLEPFDIRMDAVLTDAGWAKSWLAAS